MVEFDPSEQHYKLEQSRSELLQAEQEITKAKADAAGAGGRGQGRPAQGPYDVRRAELDVEKNELVSKIDGEKNDLALTQAKRVLAELEKDIESHHASGQASIFLAQEKHNKAKLAMDQAQQNLERMRVTAPMDGLVSIQKNMNASGGFFFTGMSLPDYRAGRSGAAGERDRAGPRSGGHEPDLEGAGGAARQRQDRAVVKVTFDAFPDHVSWHGEDRGRNDA